ncbi:Outer membrane protein TolC [Mucilaginibacter mallensis]|uniref:Outer membrane protein TolC n=2 Tax=Mucilaginibacter mallensis TaxID=652787 RepID=A0A1H1R1X3_MUCMA|nr:Outer membrane protein TolC [Mucilaginibacter mallensis]
MLVSISKRLFLVLSGIFYFINAQAQQKTLGMKDAEQTALANYGSIKAKANQLNSSKASLKESKTEYLPDVNLSAQQVYGTVNSQFGPISGYHGLATAASGPVLANQNWNAAFGSLYVSNVNWDFFAFGKSRERVKVQKSIVNLDETDLAQEQFEHEVRVASAYLNLLVAQQLAKAEQDNLNRSIDLQTVVIARVKNGLNPGVDSSLANAQVSNARISLTNAQQTVQDQSNQLANYMGIPPQDFQLDSAFITKTPNNILVQPAISTDEHPLLKYYRNRIGVSDEQAKYLSTFAYPTFSLFGLYQGRGSGFKSDYSSNLNDYSSSYGAGADPTRYNYLLGIGVVWNITMPFRVHYQVKSQKYTSAQYQDEYNLQSEQLKDQQALAETRINSALKNYAEAPVEVKAANSAYIQKFALYKNGLANIVDFTDALYTLNRAEVDQDIASNSVWQALLYKSAATGDFGIFINNF